MKLSILGSTGSIGTQALDVLEKYGGSVSALTANSDVLKMEEQIRHFSPACVAMANEQAAADLRVRVGDLPVRVLAGTDGVCECAALEGADICLNAIVGMAGLRPTLAALHTGKRMALANKETLVAGGKLVMDTAKRCHAEIIPVDSEHSAVFQCLLSHPSNGSFKRILLTASGGPFFGKTSHELQNVTAADALQHPNWSMGAKITVDSATMFNKGLELIEACHLFHATPKQIEILVHRESIVHSMVEFEDNAVIAQLGLPDMRIPIQFALTYPERFTSPVPPLDFAALSKLSFFKPDYETFDCLGICREAYEKGGLFPCAVNAANEEANALFRSGKIRFSEIGQLIRTAFSLECGKKEYTLEDIEAVAQQAKASVTQAVLSA